MNHALVVKNILFSLYETIEILCRDEKRLKLLPDKHVELVALQYSGKTKYKYANICL